MESTHDNLESTQVHNVLKCVFLSWHPERVVESTHETVRTALIQGLTYVIWSRFENGRTEN